MRRHRLMGLLFAAAVVTAAGLAAAQPAQAENPIVKLVSNQNGKCLQPASPTQGASVIQSTCNGTVAQQWTIVSVNSTRVHLASRATGNTECADAFGPAANGTPIILWPCNGISNENWGFGITNNLLSSAVSNTWSHCIATPGANDGLPMELRFCDGNSSQLWSRPNGKRAVAVVLGLVAALGFVSPAAAVLPGSPIFTIFSDLNILCVQPAGGSVDAGAAVVLAPCRESAVQDWVRDDLGGGVIHYRNVNSNLCLDAFGSATNATPAIQWPCNTISNERWQPVHVGPDGPDDFAEKILSRVSGTSGYCLDVPGDRETVGLQVQIYGCNGTIAQTWYEYV